ncbi:MAG TPA: alpha/beta hydrolase [Polyangiales bacterium]|nr:alpha/beta hydrolase [Polyangiales bacterium]
MANVTSNDGAVINYQAVGSGPALVLVDGALAHSRFRRSPPPPAALAHYTLVTYDRRGRGDSGDAAAYDPEREVDDVAALVERLGAPVALYGFSSGAALALRAAARLREQVSQLVLHDAPYGGSDEAARREFLGYAEQMKQLISEQRRSDALSLFLSDMLAPDALAALKTEPDWPVMERVAHTLVYDNAILGDGAVPVALAQQVTAATWVLDSEQGPPFVKDAADALAAVIPRARRKTVQGAVPLAALLR